MSLSLKPTIRLHAHVGLLSLSLSILDAFKFKVHIHRTIEGGGPSSSVHTPVVLFKIQITCCAYIPCEIFNLTGWPAWGAQKETCVIRRLIIA
jgi:hypothetical protein